MCQCPSILRGEGKFVLFLRVECYNCNCRPGWLPIVAVSVLVVVVPILVESVVVMPVGSVKVGWSWEKMPLLPPRCVVCMLLLVPLFIHSFIPLQFIERRSVAIVRKSID